MKTYTHPDGRTATVQAHPHQYGVLVTYTGPDGVGTDASATREVAERYLAAKGYLDDQVENAARWCFFKKAAVKGSPECDLMDKLVAAFDQNEDVPEDGLLAMDIMQGIIDQARKQLACQ